MRRRGRGVCGEGIFYALRSDFLSPYLTCSPCSPLDGPAGIGMEVRGWNKRPLAEKFVELKSGYTADPGHFYEEKPKVMR